MIQSEYLRFLQTLIDDDTSDEVRKVANLVLTHLDSLIPLSTTRGQRINKLVELAQANWIATNTDIQPAPQQATSQTCPFTRLKSISVGPFRGFAKQEDFDLASQLVLIYGPNGTGKSSFCEALEFGLLGTVAEAESKRFHQQDYLKNAHTKTFTPPELIGTDPEGNDISISANEALYRFCFVEKNRIDSFSRIAAQAPAKQTELISTLFGLDAFTGFVGNFTSTMDGRYIDLEGTKAKELAKKREALAGYQQQLKTTIPDELKSIDEAETALAKDYREGCSFDELVAELNGVDEQPGHIKRLENELQKQLPPKRNLTVEGLGALKLSIESDVTELAAKQGELAKASQQVSFRQLYEAVADLQETSPEQCPACQTPLSQATVNPFSHASDELKKLEHLGLLQEAVKTLQERVSTSLSKLAELINICCSLDEENNPLTVAQAADGKAADIDWWCSLLQKSGDDLSSYEHLESQVKSIEETDKEIDKATTERAKKQAELEQLREHDKKIIELQTRTGTAAEAKKKAEEAIAKFAEENAELINEVEAEKPIVAQNTAIADAYDSFVRKLNEYKEGLPAQLVADLGEKVVEIYNAFNRNDAEQEKLGGIRLPLSQNQRLEISFKKDPDEFFDALHILSEGHIRCIGLAILTAKNLKEDCPLLIFDDPVNAIDDEHRQAIRETLFLEGYFSGKQLIIAIHGEEFFNRTHQIIGKEAAKNARSYLFSAREGQHLQMNSLNRPKNYVLAARELYETAEYRDSLMSARRALEQLAEAVWFHYGRYCDKSDKPISVARRSPSQPWDLRYLADNLKSKINKSKAEIPGKADLVESLQVLLGSDAQQPPWTYLNKGTHDETDLPEFEQNVVDQIITALETIDNALRGTAS
jgi:DNA sulfur modification protein DndD